jgi:hypothetical protein
MIFKIIYEFICINPVSRAYRTRMCASVSRNIGLHAILKIVVGLTLRHPRCVVKITKCVEYVYVKGYRGGTVVKVLRYKSDNRWFDSRWCHWYFSLT